jgi:hypothetical protein
MNLMFRTFKSKENTMTVNGSATNTWQKMLLNNSLLGKKKDKIWRTFRKKEI